MLNSEIVPTRSAVLQLTEEHGIIKEAYNFLDEKRLLLAAELLRQLAHYEQLLNEFEVLRKNALQALTAMVRRHGLHGSEVYPANYLEEAKLVTKKSICMGVTLIDSKLELPENTQPKRICQLTPEATASRALFLQMITLAGQLAGVSGNLHRLLAEYRRTERRARALENVVLPEIEQVLNEITTQLDEMDQEDIIRVHQKHGK